MLRDTNAAMFALFGIYFFVGATALTAQGDIDKVFPYTINNVTLDNGLKIVSIPFDSPGIVAFYTVVRTGSFPARPVQSRSRACGLFDAPPYYLGRNALRIPQRSH